MPYRRQQHPSPEATQPDAPVREADTVAVPNRGHRPAVPAASNDRHGTPSAAADHSLTGGDYEQAVTAITTMIDRWWKHHNPVNE